MYVVSAFRRTSREVRLKLDTTYYMEPKTALGVSSDGGRRTTHERRLRPRTNNQRLNDQRPTTNDYSYRSVAIGSVPSACRVGSKVAPAAIASRKSGVPTNAIGSSELIPNSTLLNSCEMAAAPATPIAAP